MLTKSMCWDASAVIILARLGLLGLLKLQIVTRHFWHFLSWFPVVCITCITWTTPLSNHAKFSKKSQRSMMIHVMLRLQKGRPPSSCHCWDCNWRPACHPESQTHSGSHPSVHEKKQWLTKMTYMFHPCSLPWLEETGLSWSIQVKTWQMYANVPIFNENAPWLLGKHWVAANWLLDSDHLREFLGSLQSPRFGQRARKRPKGSASLCSRGTFAAKPLRYLWKVADPLRCRPLQDRHKFILTWNGWQLGAFRWYYMDLYGMLLWY